jgi:TldD protein
LHDFRISHPRNSSLFVTYFNFRLMRKLFVSFFAFLNVCFSLKAQTNSDALMAVIETELSREMKEFSKASLPPYYLAYRVNERKTHVVASSFGSLVGSDKDEMRLLVTDIKVGDYSFDNSHQVKEYDEMDFGAMGGSRGIQLPMDNRSEAIQSMLWNQTQNAYRAALKRFKSIKSEKEKSENKVSDFSTEKPAVFIEQPIVAFDKFFQPTAWEQRIKKISSPFLNQADIVDATASIMVGTERKYFLSSEGARIAENRTYAYLTVSSSIRAEDGDIVPLHLSYFAFTPDQLPTDEIILKDVEKMIAKLKLLRTAPVAEPYTGPAILHAHAAGVFFHEIFGHRVEGHRLKDKNDGQTFKGKVKEQVLPKSLNVIFDPTLPKYNEQALNGYYQYDDEGVKGQKVKVVEKGVLNTFLMSRTPIENFPNSNGHGRADAGIEPVSRQSNLIIENSKIVPMEDLRKMLISECKKQKKAYGYFFKDVEGGFTQTDRFMPNAFDIFPLEVYRVFVDGRPDELVRGVDLIGTPLAMFAEIQAADDKHEVFTGFCGAESGSVPVTAISPSLFVKRIETQKKPMTQVDKTLLDKPSDK